MINWTTQEITSNGYDINSAEHYAGMVGYCHMRSYAKERNIRIEDTHGFRLQENDWVIVHKFNPTAGYIENAVLNF